MSESTKGLTKRERRARNNVAYFGLGVVWAMDGTDWPAHKALTHPLMRFALKKLWHAADELRSAEMASATKARGGK